jgi:hypothetical protein
MVFATARGNMRQQGVRGLAVYCLNHACLRRTVFNVDDYPAKIEIPPFRLRMKRSSTRCRAPYRNE